MTEPAITLACPECGAPMELRTSPRFGPFYGCSTWPACSGTHGAHPNGAPLGIPANRATKLARIRAHEAFDRLWKTGLLRSRKAAYRWMRDTLSLSREDAHIARFTIADCNRLVALALAFESRQLRRRRVGR